MIFFIFSKCQTIFFSEKSSDYGINGQEEQKETPGTLGCSYMGLHSAVIAAYEIETALFVPFFGLLQIILEIICASFCNPNCVFIKKPKDS